jgi:hypothetical protein
MFVRKQFSAVVIAALLAFCAKTDAGGKTSFQE